MRVEDLELYEHMPCGWPKLKVFFHIHKEVATELLLFESDEEYYEFCDYEIVSKSHKDSHPRPRVFFTRDNGRWKYRNQFFCSEAHVGMQLFQYGEDVSDAQIAYMNDFVRTLGCLIDQAYLDNQRNNRHIASRKKEFQETQAKFIREDRSCFAVTQAEEEFHLEPDYVYLMRHTNGLIKIGASRTPTAREKTLQAEDPRLELFYASRAVRTTESRIHKAFKDLRVRGEWFRLEERHIDWIMFLCGENQIEKLQI